MKKLLINYFFLVLPVLTFAQGTINVPVDIVYYPATANYFLSNSFEGNGNILKLDMEGNVENIFFSGLHYPGGVCLVDDILYVGDNYGKWDDYLPSYLVGIDIHTGQQVLNFLVSASSTYIDLMTSDSSGNIYMANSGTGNEDGKVQKYNIATQTLTDLVTQTFRPNGVCYDYIDDRIIFMESTPGISFLKSISPEGGEVTKIFYMNQRINSVIMHDNGEFYLASWGPNDIWGDESVYKANHSLTWNTAISTGHNRPLGMCVGADNYLVVCNWGEASLSFIDLDLFGVNESVLAENHFNLIPNPAHSSISIDYKDIDFEILEIYIHDIVGNEVYHEKLGRSEIIDRKINIDHLKAGSYIVNVFDGQQSMHQNLVVY
jgi:sugar lactone lactonase YvrE